MSTSSSPYTRRDLGAALTAFAALAALPAGAHSASAPSNDTPPSLTHSRIFQFAQLPASTGANGNVTRPVLQGTLATGEYVEVHETTLAPGQMPHAPHRHTHSELLLIREGTLEVHSEDQVDTVTAGGVIFTASAVLHSLKNIGSTPAAYFVVAIGTQHMLP